MILEMPTSSTSTVALEKNSWTPFTKGGYKRGHFTPKKTRPPFEKYKKDPLLTPYTTPFLVCSLGPLFAQKRPPGVKF